MSVISKMNDQNIPVLFRKLDERFDEFVDLNVLNVICRVPRVSAVENKRYHRCRVNFPVSYMTNSVCRVRVHGTIYDLYRKNYNTYFIDTCETDVLTQDHLTKFSSTIQFSFVFYMYYTILRELKERKIKVDLTDHVFGDLTKRFHTPGGDMKFFFSFRALEGREHSSSNFYLSIFN